jgi:hypothetical protein
MEETQGVSIDEELSVFESRPMGSFQVGEMDKLKGDAAVLLHSMNQIVPKEERSEASRLMNIARTNLEQTIMWSIKAISRKEQ